jgi:hypothetical protein
MQTDRNLGLRRFLTGGRRIDHVSAVGESPRASRTGAAPEVMVVGELPRHFPLLSSNPSLHRRWALGDSRLSSTMPPPAADFANGSSDLLADMYTSVKSSLVFTDHPGGRCAAADTCRRESRPRSVPRVQTLHFRPPKPTKRRARTWNPLLPRSAAGPARRSHRLADRVQTLADHSPSRSIRLCRQLQRTDIAFSPVATS